MFARTKVGCVHYQKLKIKKIDINDPYRSEGRREAGPDGRADSGTTLSASSEQATTR